MKISHIFTKKQRDTLDALRDSDFDKKQAAENLGISYMALMSRLNTMKNKHRRALVIISEVQELIEFDERFGDVL